MGNFGTRMLFWMMVGAWVGALLLSIPLAFVAGVTQVNWLPDLIVPLTFTSLWLIAKFLPRILEMYGRSR